MDFLITSEMPSWYAFNIAYAIPRVAFEEEGSSCFGLGHRFVPPKKSVSEEIS